MGLPSQDVWQKQKPTSQKLEVVTTEPRSQPGPRTTPAMLLAWLIIVHERTTQCGVACRRLQIAVLQ